MSGILVIGGGIGGLALALRLHRNGIRCTLLEAAAEIRPLGVGVSILPQAVAELARLGVAEPLQQLCVQPTEVNFFNRFGQHVHAEPLGRAAGYPHPQMSLHRADLHGVLLAAVRDRLGEEAVLLDRRIARVEQDEDGVTVQFTPDRTGAVPPLLRGSVAVGCDGIHSVLRRQLYPREGEPRYAGCTMWRGVTRWPPIPGGACMARVGWLKNGRMVLYPIRDHADGTHLLHWVFEVETAQHRARRDWNRPGEVEDIMPWIRDWSFDWLDVPAMVRASEVVLEFPVVEQDPLPRWSFGRLTLLGDAAHPMAPRGSSGAGEAIFDACCLADRLARHADDPEAALKAYEAERLPATTQAVLANRRNPQDAILREVFLRTGDRPFDRIGDVMSREEMLAIAGDAGQVAGGDLRMLRAGAEPT